MDAIPVHAINIHPNPFAADELHERGLRVRAVGLAGEFRAFGISGASMPSMRMRSLVSLAVMIVRVLPSATRDDTLLDALWGLGRRGGASRRARRAVADVAGRDPFHAAVGQGPFQPAAVYATSRTWPSCLQARTGHRVYRTAPGAGARRRESWPEGPPERRRRRRGSRPPRPSRGGRAGSSTRGDGGRRAGETPASRGGLPPVRRRVREKSSSRTYATVHGLAGGNTVRGRPVQIAACATACA
jgi:hypothetical protein